MSPEANIVLPEVLENIAMSCRMEGIELTPEIRALCLSVLNGNISLQDSLRGLNAKYNQVREIMANGIVVSADDCYSDMRDF